MVIFRPLLFVARSIPQCGCTVQKRFRSFKKKWASNTGPQDPRNIALEHFDMFYRPVYQDLWPSIRISLLSEQKYAAVVNNFGARDKAISDLESQGALDIISMARQCQREANDTPDFSGISDYTHTEIWADEVQPDSLGNVAKSIESNVYDDCDRDIDHDSDQSTAPMMSSLPSTDQPTSNSVYDFMPVVRINSEKEERRKALIESSVFTNNALSDVIVEPDTHGPLPFELSVMVQEPGSVKMFTPPKPDTVGLLGYYLLDAASILPVIALDLQPTDSVLDACAAPGGKTFIMLQTRTTDSITCTDKSYARLSRLKEIIKFYGCDEAGKLQIHHIDALELNTPAFNKVLVDVPCNTDRHMLFETDNNLFKPGRMPERTELPNIQKELLKSAIQSCAPGGCVVYSTCTLSPAQNDGIVQSAIEDVWESHQVRVAVQDLCWIRDAFHTTFRFHPSCRYGQLVLPKLTANFGPLYFSKLRKLE